MSSYPDPLGLVWKLEHEAARIEHSIIGDGDLFNEGWCAGMRDAARLLRALGETGQDQHDQEDDEQDPDHEPYAIPEVRHDRSVTQ